MRLWSIHPKYLDTKGLVALWRETLLAKNVLSGKTRGYINHPQLLRFRSSENPISLINEYLLSIFEESIVRGYSFNRYKIDIFDVKSSIIPVTNGQVLYEFNHLQKKLKSRNYDLYLENSNIDKIFLNRNFRLVPGDIESWEKV